MIEIVEGNFFQILSEILYILGNNFNSNLFTILSFSQTYREIDKLFFRNKRLSNIHWFSKSLKNVQCFKEKKRRNTNKHTDFFNGTDSSHTWKKKDSKNDKTRCPDSSEVGASATSDYTFTTGSDGAGPPRFRSQRHRTPPWFFSHTATHQESLWDWDSTKDNKPKLKKGVSRKDETTKLPTRLPEVSGNFLSILLD